MAASYSPEGRLLVLKERSSKVAGVSLLSLAFCALSALGQMNTGEVSGTVQDQLGGLLPGATIIAEQTQNGQRFSAVSNSAGEYLFPQLPVGPYSLRASATSFKQSALPQFEIHAGEKLRHSFTLQLGDGNEILWT